MRPAECLRPDGSYPHSYLNLRTFCWERIGWLNPTVRREWGRGQEHTWPLMASLMHPSVKSRSQLPLWKLVAYIHPRWLESPSRSLPPGICQPCLWPAASFPPWQLVWNEGNHNFISRTKLLEIASTSRFFFTGPAILTVIMDKRNIHKKESSNNKYLLVTVSSLCSFYKAPNNMSMCSWSWVHTNLCCHHYLANICHMCQVPS